MQPKGWGSPGLPGLRGAAQSRCSFSKPNQGSEISMSPASMGSTGLVQIRSDQISRVSRAQTVGEGTLSHTDLTTSCVTDQCDRPAVCYNIVPTCSKFSPPLDPVLGLLRSCWILSSGWPDGVVGEGMCAVELAIAKLSFL